MRTIEATIDNTIPQAKLKPHWGNIAGIALVHIMSIVAFFYFSWSALVLAFVMYAIISPIGITLTYHRLLSHRAFKVPRWLEYTLATFGALSGQGPVLIWCAEHRLHHRHSDTENDPHSARHGGFWWSHMNHLFFHKEFEDNEQKWSKLVPDLYSQKYYHFLSKYNSLIALSVAPVLYYFGGWQFILWGMFVRITFMLHITWFVNSATHRWGYRNFNTKDDSGNVWWVAIFAAGEGWHNNHHAEAHCAAHGRMWWEFDLTWQMIKFLKFVGLATNVKMPRPVAQVQARELDTIE
jgi:stearoyl-CoA desaturase (delta-9 desaturase)